MKNIINGSLIAAVLFSIGHAYAAVSPKDAEKLRSELTPLGAERAGNAEGTIPAWTGGFTTVIAGEVPGGRRGDPFKDEKPILTITAANVGEYADKLTDGTKAMLAKYPDSYRLDVYKTHRTAAAPDWVYENTFKNATRAKLNGDVLADAFGGIPFPIPQSGAEIMWNHILRWRGGSTQVQTRQYQLLANGKAVLATDLKGDVEMPYYFRESTLEEFSKNNEFWLVRTSTSAPAMRAGEALLGRANTDSDKAQAWVYLTGQRRIRKLPNICCDTPSPTMGGIASFDEIEGFTGRLDRFDWKIVGKKEIYIPYNGNRLMQPSSDEAVLSSHHLNPDYVRWELHRVWVVEANLRQGQRHQAPKNRYYCDEDTWICVLGDRWDAKGQLWKTTWAQTALISELPALALVSYGLNDLISGDAFVGGLYNSKQTQYSVLPRFPASTFTPDALMAEGVR
ncbi:DUF1329 domain-containing protein [Pseudomonas sp. CES]|uniref:DUF1329 domain-containing protein n=1 Tax=Pseudomonas sp. CES TaxID=2719586 RepID=UPI0014707972|nr:DUF1329 domain-containing protein [Pseudomonas sp. CES]KAF4558098.1 DUF1329 domain-containing protein [Pseudomonas sp. CES]